MAKVSAKDVELYVYKVKLKRVTDGDTVVVEIDLGFYMTLETPVRLARIDAPELGTPLGTPSKNWLDKMLSQLSPLICTTTKPHDKYGRFLAEIWAPVAEWRQQIPSLSDDVNFPILRFKGKLFWSVSDISMKLGYSHRYGE